MAQRPTPPVAFQDGLTRPTPSQGSTRISRQTLEWYQGLIPHPDHVERFEAVCPGATDRFIGMAERQGTHRQKLESRFMTFNGASQIIGVVFAGLTVLGGIAAGTFLLYHDKNTEGLTALLTPLAAVGAIFVGSKISQSREKKRKQA